MRIECLKIAANTVLGRPVEVVALEYWNFILPGAIPRRAKQHPRERSDIQPSLSVPNVLSSIVMRICIAN